MITRASLQESLQMKMPLGGNITQLRGHRAGISSQATLLVTVSLRGLLQIIRTLIDSITSGIKSSDRTGMQTGFCDAVQTGGYGRCRVDAVSASFFLTPHLGAGQRKSTQQCKSIRMPQSELRMHHDSDG